MKLYIINEVGTNNYKIGVTRKSVNNRLRAMQTGNSDKLRKVASVTMTEKDALEEESRLHKLFSPCHKNGEWFEMNLATLRECAAEAITKGQYAYLYGFYDKILKYGDFDSLRLYVILCLISVAIGFVLFVNGLYLIGFLSGFIPCIFTVNYFIRREWKTSYNNFYYRLGEYIRQIRITERNR